MDSYTKEELCLLRPDEWPQRGPLCERCRTHIPLFADLSAAQECSLRQLAEKGSAEAIEELMRLTGCSLRWAKIWVLHPDGPKPKYATRGPPCRCCGEPLRSEDLGSAS